MVVVVVSEKISCDRSSLSIAAFFVNQANRGNQLNEGEEKEECEKTSFAKSEIRLKVSINAKKKKEEKTEFSDARFKKRKARRKLQWHTHKQSFQWADQQLES